MKNKKKPKVRNPKFKKLLVTCYLLLIGIFVTCHLSLVTALHAEVLERIVAIIDDDVITLSEFKDALIKAQESKIKITEEEVINGMINRVILLREAKKFRAEDSAAGVQALKDDKIINDYIDKRLRALIRIPPEGIELYYEKNKQSFGSKDFYDVRSEIETYLTEKELNNKLLEHIKELRKKSYIRIQLEADD